MQDSIQGVLCILFPNNKEIKQINLIFQKLTTQRGKSLKWRKKLFIYKLHDKQKPNTQNNIPKGECSLL